MLTKWGKIIASIEKATSSTTNMSTQVLPPFKGGTTAQALISAKSIGGNNFYINTAYASSGLEPITTALVESGTSCSKGIAFGGGDTTPTENDYTLESQITGFSATTPSFEAVVDVENSKYITRLDITITNDTGSTITIKEIGFFLGFGTSTTKGGAASTSSSNRKSFMIDRTVLNAPVVIANGEAGVVRYEFAYSTE